LECAPAVETVEVWQGVEVCGIRAAVELSRRDGGKNQKDEVQTRECRPCKNQKAQFLKNGQSGFLVLWIFNPDRLLAHILRAVKLFDWKKRDGA
jgi:hypothetical protein